MPLDQEKDIKVNMAILEMTVSSALFLLCFIAVSTCSCIEAGNFYDDTDITWGDHRAKILEGGKLQTLSLDEGSGSGFQSKREYLFGRFDMNIKLVSGKSAGTVTAYYLSLEGPNHDEVDFEFLGNVGGQPYIVHTNVYTRGRGSREQQFYLWFDPAKKFHTYSIVWNPQNIIFLVDEIPIRVFNNHEVRGVPFPNRQPMKLYSSLWGAEQWATRGGLDKTNWTCAPFTVSFRDFNFTPCLSPNCSSSSVSTNNNAKQLQSLNAHSRKLLRWVRKHHMVYNHRKDLKRFPQGLP